MKSFCACVFLEIDKKIDNMIDVKLVGFETDNEKLSYSTSLQFTSQREAPVIFKVNVLQVDLRNVKGS